MDIDFVRYYFECENGRRWTETNLSGQLSTKDGDTCNFSGCLNDHKVKLFKKTIDTGVLSSPDSKEAFKWFKGWDTWEDTPVYKSIKNIFPDGEIIAYNSQSLKKGTG